MEILFLRDVVNDGQVLDHIKEFSKNRFPKNFTSRSQLKGFKEALNNDFISRLTLQRKRDVFEALWREVFVIGQEENRR
ncbi:MAG: hypothetical protein ACI4HI_08705 [Lachnospiraceae bacterium]